MIDEVQMARGEAPDVTAVTRPERGKLSLFFGMAPGMGKTSAMLQSARDEKLAGRDVLVACVETHGCPATLELARSLPSLPAAIQTGGEPATLDLDTVLARRPDIAVVDDLARANPPGARHPRRYQDALELLEAGIDVHATLEVRQVASRADTVREITGEASAEVVPDSVLDGAQIELVDLTPEKLLKRLGETRAGQFREDQLRSLRQMTLRLVAERAGQDLAKPPGRAPRSGQRLLVAVGPGPMSEEIVRWTGRLAESLNAPWLAVHVENPHATAGFEASQLRGSLALAQELGAEVVTVADSDVARALLRVAGQRNVTQIIIGAPRAGPVRRFFQGDPVLRNLVLNSGAIELRVVPAAKPAPADAPPSRPPDLWMQYFVAVMVVSAVMAVASTLVPAIGYHVVALVGLLSVVVLALFVGRGPTLVAATLSALLWNFFFLEPVHTFRIRNFEDMVLFGMYFVVALVLGQLTARTRAQEKAKRQEEERATALYLLIRELTGGADLDQMLEKVARQANGSFHAPALFWLPGGAGLRLHPAGAGAGGAAEHERRAAERAFEQGRPAGKFTGVAPLAEAHCVPLATRGGALGVMGLRFQQAFPPTIHQRNLLDAFSQQIALALDRHRLQGASEQSMMLAQSERLGRNLLNSVSHEMRTPIAAIQNATGNLAEFGEAALSGPQQEMLAEIQEAAERLDRLVGNLLDITRLESGSVKPRFELCDVKDLVHVVVKDTAKALARHKLAVELAPDLPLVRMDFVLMQQALVNLLSNAAVHTPPGTPVQLEARVAGGALILGVADRGPGIPPESLARIFDKFYRAPAAPTGGTGLGLSLVKGFVEAHGGQAAAENRPDGGARFVLRLPLDQPAPSANPTPP